jgi:hypothetical protein
MTNGLTKPDAAGATMPIEPNKTLKRARVWFSRELTMSTQNLFHGEVIMGWGVVRDRPWDFKGIFECERDALSVANKSGHEYKVRYGQSPKNRPGFKVIVDR